MCDFNKISTLNKYISEKNKKIFDRGRMYMIWVIVLMCLCRWLIVFVFFSSWNIEQEAIRWMIDRTVMRKKEGHGSSGRIGWGWRALTVLGARRHCRSVPHFHRRSFFNPPSPFNEVSSNFIIPKNYTSLSFHQKKKENFDFLHATSHSLSHSKKRSFLLFINQIRFTRKKIALELN